MSKPRGSAWTTSSAVLNPMKPSLVARAIKRRVRDGGEKRWIVEGNHSLGDSYPEYVVTQNGEGIYHCECHDHSNGEMRARVICSHVTAAILHRQGKHPLSQRDTEPIEASLSNSPFAKFTPPASRGSEWNLQWNDSPLSPTIPPSTPQLVVPATTPEADEEEEGVEEGQRNTDSTPLPSEVGGIFDDALPAKFTEYQHSQWATVREVTEAFEAGFKVVFLDAPTGSGKTLIAESVRRELDVRAIYTCTTKTLQDQIMRDFGEYAQVIKGRANYPTLDNPTSDLTAADCTKRKTSIPACESCPSWTPEMAYKTTGKRKVEGQQDFFDHTHAEEEENEHYHCSNCHPIHQCPYNVAKMTAARTRLAVLNTAYFLAETNYVTKTPFRNWPLVILDEADRLEEELMGFVEVEISPRMRKNIGVGLPKKKTKDEDWVRWLVEEVIPGIKKRLRELSQSSSVAASREERALNNLRRSIEWVIEKPRYDDGTEGQPVLQSGWVYTGYEKEDSEKVTVTFKPVKVDQFAPAMLWAKGERFLVMSASFVSPEQTASDLGLEEGEWTVVSMRSTFPVINRPIFPVDVASVTHKTKGTAYPLIADAIETILDMHPEERVLIHTVSYDLGRYMMDELYKTKHGRRLSTYYSAQYRIGALDRYLSDPRGVLLAPSFDRGVDLVGDDCRVIVVPKIPFGNLGDKQISTRFYGTGRGGKTWYKVQAIRTLVQMTGRGMRSAEDYCTTYVLDSNFTRLYQETRRLFPSWWSEAIVWDEYDPKWKGVRGSAREIVTQD